MRLGFLTSCMPERSLEQIAAWAGAHGYEALELAAWPTVGDRPFTASHIAADAFDEAEAELHCRASTRSPATGVQAPSSAAEASTAAVIRTARRPSAKTGIPSATGSPPIAA